ncbi:MAG TPA: phytanoyl-CoA dioxygenase family protein [Limnochordia bacterium]|nr:phytanoyl-CoA dioxygenase family protein [Limnochordia bacterium]
MRLTEAQLQSYRDDGYVVIENLIPPEMVKGLQERLREYTHGNRAAAPPIKFQVEPRVARGELSVAHPGDGIRKIDGLVQGDDRYRALALHDNVVGIIEQILGPDLKLFRNSLLLKPPGVGSAKGAHQDSPYWPIEPMELCSLWFAIDDATPENGCMAVIPGGHKVGALPHVPVTDDYVIADGHYDPEQLVLAPIKAGGGLFFHSLLPHYTAPNTSDRWRRAIALSYMSAQSTYTGKGESPVYFPIKGRTFPGRVA